MPPVGLLTSSPDVARRMRGPTALLLPETPGGSSTIRWNPRLSKAFDVTAEQFPAASAEEALVSKYLDVEIKHLERRQTKVMSVRMGAFLTAVDQEMASGWSVDDVRNIDWQGRETTPLYQTIELNSTRQADFLVEGMRFLRREDDGTQSRATIRVQPRWYGLDVSVYGLRAKGTAEHVLGSILARASTINFLKGEAFALSGEFLPKTNESFDDLFLDTANASSIERLVRLINERGKALENRGVLLMGPPGTGKTLSARIVRNQAQATFIWVSARDFHYAGSFGGFTEAFDLARECAPSVIVFEDVDNWLYDTTVDLLKTEMDGVSQSTGVVTMMTTNFPELLPSALIDRPGRFHDVLRFGLPDATARTAMLERWLPGLAASDLKKAVDATAGYSGAHVRELARFAMIIAEQDQLPLSGALATALTKLAEQRELINATQRSGSRFRMPAELVSKCGVRIERSVDFAEKGDSIGRMHRAFYTLQIKSISESGRRFSGLATTPTPDRVGDIIEPLGVQFRNPMPLLLFHDTTLPVGEVNFGTPAADGVPFDATIPEVVEDGEVKDITDKAAHFVKYRLIKAVSVGFRSFAEFMERIKETGGFRFLKSEILELSLVPIPANPDALIHSTKALPAPAASSSATPPVQPSRAGVSADRAPRVRMDGSPMRTITEQISSFEATRQAKAARMTELMTKAGEVGMTLDAAQSEEYDTLETEVKGIDAHLKRLDDLEKTNRVSLRPVVATTPAEASFSRGGAVVVKDNLPPGIEFARYAMCLASAQGNRGEALEIAKHRYPDQARIQNILKAAVAAGTTTDATWAGSLVDYTNFAGDFIEYLRPQTIIGKFGTGGIPSLRRVPFNIKVQGQTTGGAGYWVGQGAPKPVTKFDFAGTTLTWAKVAAIAVLTEELVRFSSPAAEGLVRDALAAAVIERIDIDFVDPAKAAVANVSPASITNGVSAIQSHGTDLVDVKRDMTALFQAFITANITPTNGVFIMSASTALALSLMTNALGQREFPDITMLGGRFMGLPVIVSQYIADGSPTGSIVVLVNASDVYLADDGQVVIDVSREASLQMDNAPTNNSATPTATTMVSLWQTNSVGLRAERFINWAKRRAAAAAFLDNVQYNAAGSPE